MGAGDVAFWADVAAIVAATTDKPLVRLVASGPQTLADNTPTAIAFSGADDIDTHGYHDPASNNTRITPLKAGYYTARCTFFMSSLVNGATIDVNVRKSGTTTIAPAGRLGGAAGHTVTTSGAPSTIGAGNAFSVATQTLVSVNGTTDYVEMMARQDSNAADDTNQSTQFSCVFELIYERPL